MKEGDPVSRLKIRDIDTALLVYYENPEIGNKEIIDLFGPMSSATVSKLKQNVRKKMIELEIKPFKAYTVHTKTAFEVWGIDVDDLEKRRTKLMKLGLYPNRKESTP